MTINIKNGTEMNVCFVDPNSSFLNVVGYGNDGNDALLSAINSSPLTDDKLKLWVETLDQYFITDEAVKCLGENGTCRCAFSDDDDDVVEKA